MTNFFFQKYHVYQTKLSYYVFDVKKTSYMSWYQFGKWQSKIKYQNIIINLLN